VVERLLHVVLGAELESEEAIVLRRAGAVNDDRNVGRRRVPLQRLQHVAAVGRGEVHVEQHEIGPFGEADLEGTRAVERGRHGEARFARGAHEGREQQRVVVDDEHASLPAHDREYRRTDSSRIGRRLRMGQDCRMR
jgi:hypothetical protein